METWTTSVTQLIQLFRGALVALLPTMEAARIPWKDGEAYDEWDEITQSLYRNIVVRTLQAAAHNEETTASDDLLPPYNMKLRTYCNRGVILVTGVRLKGVAVFVGLSSREAPFDTADCVEVDDAGNVTQESVKQSLRDAAFSFTVFGASEVPVTEVSIEL